MTGPSGRPWAAGLAAKLWARARGRRRDTAPSLRAYQVWQAEHEPGPAELDRQRSIAQSWPYRPLISILTPVHNPDPQALRQMLASVRAQTYDNWELCLVDGGSEIPDVPEVLREFAEREPRQRLSRVAKNLGISGNSNLALAMARGDFVALLDHDDVLAPFALFEVVQALNNPAASDSESGADWDLLYSDHDVLSADGAVRSRPLFKPGWSPEILLSANYLTHLTVLRTTLVRMVGGFDAATDGAQDWDLFLRIVERTQKVAHIPKVLYHWRDSAGSTASNIWAKAYAPPAQLRVIAAHLVRQGLPQARAFFDTSGFIRVGWEAPRSGKVSIIIPSRGSSRLLEGCVGSLLQKTEYSNYEIIIVNNGARQPEAFAYYRRLAKEPRVRVVHDPAPFNYSEANNYGVRQAVGEFLLFLNNDTEIIAPDWLDELTLWVARPEIGVVGALLLKPDGLIQHAGVVVGLDGFAGHVFAGAPEGQGGPYGFTHWYRNFLAVTGACLMVRREVFEQAGGFDESFQLCGSDVALCLQTQKLGYRVVLNPFARLKHLESATHRGSIPAQDFERSLACYAPWLQQGDPYYNPNLSYWRAVPMLHQRGERAPWDFAREFVRAREKTA